MAIKVAIGSDHAGFALKEQLKSVLSSPDFEINDFGTYSDESTDYPDYAHPLSEYVEQDSQVLGILICGSANGVCMTANKHQNVRAALCWTPEIARLARQHNNANVLCLPARYLTEEEAKEITTEFIETPFEGGRHKRRVEKIACI